MAWTSPSSRSTGTLITSSIWNQDVVDNPAFLYGAPGCRVYHNTNQNIANTGGIVSFNSEVYDNATMHDNSTNNSRITIPVAGVYLVYANIYWASNATGYRAVEIKVDGGGPIGSQYHIDLAATALFLCVAIQYKFTAGQYIEVFAYQNSGGALALTYSADGAPYFGATWISSGA